MTPTPSERLALALESKLSVTTVFRVYKGDPGARPATVEAVTRAAKRLKLPPPPQAQEAGR